MTLDAIMLQSENYTNEISDSAKIFSTTQVINIIIFKLKVPVLIVYSILNKSSHDNKLFNINIRIKHGFSCTVICQVPRALMKTEDEHLPDPKETIKIQGQ